MGVPKFYRWLSERYPLINQLISSAAILPEFDNFYLDMNGIIHACTHPNDNLANNSLTLREMMLSIFRYIDRIVTEIVKPKKLLFLAIDGVAPRAKLNQQRARRFRAAQDRIESLQKAHERGDMIDEENLFDSNCITPGTEFMETVSRHLKYFIRKKMKEDPLWQNLTIIFSGHDVPGEGEHKIMQYIRDQRANPNYEPNIRHCMYGQDADLIMLGLASHEPHFALLREVIQFNTFKGGKKPSTREVVMRQTKEAQFQLLHLSLLREYLTIDFAHGIHHPIDPERIMDDFIFLTFLVGNDFLPHLPTLDISEHAFDVLITAYRDLFQQSPGYIVHQGEINDLERLEKFFMVIGSKEQEILANRELAQKEWNSKKRSRKEINEEEELEKEEEELAAEAAFEEALLEAMHGKDYVPPETEEEEAVEEADDVEDEADEQKASPTSTKDYRSRYYYQKFNFLTVQSEGIKKLDEIKYHYLQGLMWCLAYYVKGCISWTWYYPFHYGPMLQDMKGLIPVSQKICFELGQPFTPYQQLLGCLPPASSNLLPKCYQWLMTNKDSPIITFYPLDFGIDQDGKKNPWEAVVLLDFIDENQLLAAETSFCTINKLTKVEILRNKFGKIICYSFDPSIVDTYLSCNPEIGLADIHHCHSKTTDLNFDLSPGHYFKSELIPGTLIPIAGFPSLTMITLNKITIDSIKINVFGSESRYQSVILHLDTSAYEQIPLTNLEQLLGRSVYVNYPQMHEAKVVGITAESEELVLVEDTKPVIGAAPPASAASSPTVKRIQHDAEEAKAWRTAGEAEEKRYLEGRGLPGTGGLRIGNIKYFIKVKLLQGLSRDSASGATKKVFSANNITEIPIQLVLLSLPSPDPRFEEVSELPIEKLLPVGAPVIAVTGQLIGCVGTIVGPHKPLNPHQKGKKKTSEEAANTSNRKKIVDVEFKLPQPEAPFGYNIAKSVKEDYFSSRDLCNLLKISPSILGKICGSVRVDPHRVEFGLNLKRKGLYQLLGYVRKVENNHNQPPKLGGSNNQKDAVGKVGRQIWQSEDVVKIIGMEDSKSAATAEEVESIYWEYSTAAVVLIGEYKYRFPKLFESLERLPSNSFSYQAKDLFPGVSNIDAAVASVQDWLKSQAFFHLPRTAFTTSSLSRDAMAAIERASDVQTTVNQTKGFTTLLVKGIPIEKIYCNLHRSSQDIPLTLNQLEPRLGDRIVNLCCAGVPFGLRGTVITIHHGTKFVEVIFDEEFIGGKSLHGNCSQFRGRLCAWSELLLISGETSSTGHSNNNSNNTSKKQITYAYSAEELGVKSVNVVNAISPKAAHRHSKDFLDVVIHHKQEEPIISEDKVVAHDAHFAPAVVVASDSGKSDSKNKKKAVPLTTYHDDEEVASIDILLQDKPLELIVKHAASSTTAEKGSGWSNLIVAAGLNTSLEESLQSVNINDEKVKPDAAVFVPPMPALIPSSPPLNTSNTADSRPVTTATVKSAPKIVLDKKAAIRIVKHELGAQIHSESKGTKPTSGKPNVADSVPPNQTTSLGNTSKPIVALLQNAKKAPASFENKERKPTVHSQGKEFKPTILKRDTATLPDAKPIDSGKTAALTMILQRTKEHTSQMEKVVKNDDVDDFDNLPPPPNPKQAVAPPAPVESNQAPPATTTTTTLEPKEAPQASGRNVKTLLAEAKKRLQSKKPADGNNPVTSEAAPAAAVVPTNNTANPPVPPSGAATTTPSLKNVTHLLFKK